MPRMFFTAQTRVAGWQVGYLVSAREPSRCIARAPGAARRPARCVVPRFPASADTASHPSAGFPPSDHPCSRYGVTVLSPGAAMSLIGQPRARPRRSIRAPNYDLSFAPKAGISSRSEDGVFPVCRRRQGAAVSGLVQPTLLTADAHPPACCCRRAPGYRCPEASLSA
jgi:hypothetical protein